MEIDEKGQIVLRHPYPSEEVSDQEILDAIIAHKIPGRDIHRFVREFQRQRKLCRFEKTEHRDPDWLDESPFRKAIRK